MTGLALGQPPQPPDAEAAIEVIVFGELLVEQARQEVVHELKQQGYTDVVKKDGRTIYRHELAYRGQVVLWDDGWMQTKRQPIQFVGREMPWAEKNSPLAWAGCVVYAPLCLKTGGALISRRKFRAVETRVVQGAYDEVATWSDRVADLATDRTVEALPEHFEALWTHGVPLDGSETPIATMAGRRAALLAYWESRTDTVWGEAVRIAVEAFCRAEVQRGEHPFTEEEIAAFNQTNRAGRPFALSRRIVAP